MNVHVKEKVAAVEKDVVNWRRYLHTYPEISYQEVETSQFVYDTLESFGNLEISRPTETSVMARLIGGKVGKTLAIRADMDALPIQEENECDYASKNDGVMHACGHDGHTAILLATAKVLTELKDEVAGEIRFLFQHAEELHPGGAQEMVKAGVLEGVDQVIGLHLMSPIDHNFIALGEGAMTANSDTFNLTIIGKGGHASEPDKTVDPIVIGAEIVSNMQHIASRNLGVNDKAVVSVTKFHGGTANNIIPETVKITGSVRTIDGKMRKLIPERIKAIIEGITKAHGATYDLSYNYGYSAVVNDKHVFNNISRISRDLFGNERVLIFPPGSMMGSEDFSAFSTEVPGCFIGIGVGNKEKGIIYPHHHPKFMIEESSLIKGVKLFVTAALEMNNE